MQSLEATDVLTRDGVEYLEVDEDLIQYLIDAGIDKFFDAEHFCDLYLKSLKKGVDLNSFLSFLELPPVNCDGRKISEVQSRSSGGVQQLKKHRKWKRVLRKIWKAYTNLAVPTRVVKPFP